MAFISEADVEAALLDQPRRPRLQPSCGQHRGTRRLSARARVLFRRGADGPPETGRGSSQPGYPVRGTARCLEEDHCRRDPVSDRREPTYSPCPGRRHRCGVLRRGRHHTRRQGPPDRISTIRRRTTGWQWTSSRSSNTATTAGRTWWCSSTACRWG